MSERFAKASDTPAIPLPSQKPRTHYSAQDTSRRFSNLAAGDKEFVRKLYNEGKTLEEILRLVKAPRCAVISTYSTLKNATIQKAGVTTYTDPATGIEVKKYPPGYAGGISPQARY